MIFATHNASTEAVILAFNHFFSLCVCVCGYVCVGVSRDCANAVKDCWALYVNLVFRQYSSPQTWKQPRYTEHLHSLLAQLFTHNRKTEVTPKRCFKILQQLI